ncbi:hypothetical protein SAMN05444280_1374 [Tangfeifania diversioriginum]|uniref:Uncharacterized protein n=1 Tax=Tangfeifania diversioriginum TaxID=1168035 RepID=A0A1M6MXA8_9BACT|nr:hypothetical protein SAMN05444280_1374 [Tangfeifania diversioriginum]
MIELQTKHTPTIMKFYKWLIDGLLDITENGNIRLNE